MKVGAPFNPYKVLQGAFAPYWILEHRGIGGGAKLCYIRLLGFGFGADGIRVDSKGNIWSSAAQGVWVFSPDGKHIGTIRIPERTANLTFGGSDGKTLLITSSTSLYTIPVKVTGIKFCLVGGICGYPELVRRRPEALFVASCCRRTLASGEDATPPSISASHSTS